MAEERTRLRVKLGAAEIEYEGASEFLRVEIMPTVEKMLAMVEARVELQNAQPLLQIQKAIEARTSPLAPNQTHSTNTIATIRQAKTASDLVIAAAAHLTFVKGKEKMTRQEIIDDMKTAAAFYKVTYLKNLTATLKVLSKSDRLRLVGPETYVLSAKERQQLEAIFASD